MLIRQAVFSLSFTLPDHSTIPTVPSTFYVPTAHLSNPGTSIGKWTQVIDLEQPDLFATPTLADQLENVLVERFIVAGSGTIAPTTLDEKLKALRLIVDVREGTTVGYTDVCYRSKYSHVSAPSDGCMDLPVETQQVIAGESDVVVTFLLRDNPVGRKYLETLRELQHVTLGVDATSSIVLSMLPYSSASAASGTNKPGEEESTARSSESVFSLYPYSSLSIFTRTNSDVFTPSQRRAYRQQQQQHHHAHLPFPSSSTAAKESAAVTSSSPASNVPGKETNPARHIKFLAYALRALVTRFWMLAKNADSADIFVVLLGYVLMHFTFVRLFLNMRKMGSSFWLRECWPSRVRSYSRG